MTIDHAISAFVDHAPDWCAASNALDILFTTTDEEINPSLFFHLGWDYHAELETMPDTQRLACIGSTARGRYILSLLIRELIDGRWTTWPPLMRRGGASVLQGELQAAGF
jgi:hypothetical protein